VSFILIIVAIGAHRLWQKRNVAVHAWRCKILGADRKSIIPIPGPRFLSRLTSLSLSPSITPATSTIWSGSAGHHAALLDSSEPAIAVVAHSPADSVAMAV